MLKPLLNVLNKSSIEYLFPRGRLKSNYRFLSKNLKPNLKSASNLSTTKVASIAKFVENSFAYSVLEPLPIVSTLKQISINNNNNKNVKTEEDFERFLNKDWRKCGVKEIVDGFNAVLPFCVENNVNITNKNFDFLVDGLLDNVENLSTDDIISVLKFLTESPLPGGLNMHNYHDVWSAMDDVCCWRLKSFDLQTSFYVANLWFKMGLGRICDFIYELLEKYSKKPARLTKSELVYIFFYFNICRKRTMDFSYEDAIEKKISLMSPDEIGIVALGFFKTKTMIKSADTLNVMIDCAINNSKSIHEITLAAIVKTIRLSHHPLTATKTAELLQVITPEIERLSHICCMHLALLGTGLQIFNKTALTKICEKLSKSIHDKETIRIKDIERLLLTLTMFDFKPKVSTTNDIYDLLLREFYNPARQGEIESHPKCLPCSLLFLAIRNIYPEDLIDGVLNPDFLKKTYGKQFLDVPRELYSLDMCLEIERPNYKGNRIPKDKRRRCAKVFIERLPKKEKKSMNAADRLIHDVLDSCLKVTGDSNKVFLGHIIPQYVKADIVLCYDELNKEFITPNFTQYEIGDIVRPPNKKNLRWIVVVPVSVNTTIRYLLKPVGFMNLKRRQLKLLGYDVVMVPYHEYIPLDEDDKVEYISSLIQRVL
ncbi:FAST kinase domain-containing protein 5, mitochondrial isoform X3 [Onthophagus taurus]|uniref:FAST kinase domain-containing protein 5, mitochondrial isoform X3 n=1 Tax=Onthophagus taurus TaxID=166361 RepID=UPI0039BEB1B5